jgi:hypothetical protein
VSRKLLVPGVPTKRRLKVVFANSAFVPSSALEALTGLSGAALILTALADLATQAASGAWDGNRLIADLTALGSGLGLIFAKDGNVTGGSVKQ